MSLILIRHGESEANKRGQNQGRNDGWANTSLSEKGKEQARQVSERLKTEKIDHIFASDLKRAKETAEAINKFHKKKIIFDSRLREKKDEETFKKFVKRVYSFMKEINKKEGNILIISHGGVNKTILGISTRSKKKGISIAKRIRMHNTSISIIHKRGRHYDIKLENCIKHLKPDKKIIKIFERIQKLPPKIQKEEIGNNFILNTDKSKMLKEELRKKGYQAKDLIVIFDAKDLPIPEKIKNILKKSGTKQMHKIVRVKIHGNYLYLDPTWPKSFEKIGFPVTKSWSGLEDTAQITLGKLFFFKKNKIEENPQRVLKRYSLKQKSHELEEFSKRLNEWLKEEYNKNGKN